MLDGWPELLTLSMAVLFTNAEGMTEGCLNEAMCRLYRALFANYDKDNRPSRRHDMPVDILFAFSLTNILDLDERNQVMTANAWIHQGWKDFRLVWWPRDFEGIKKIQVPHTVLWLPDVILYNNAAADYSRSTMSTDITVEYDGNVTWTMAGIFKSSCSLDVRYYPFDSQLCTLRFASWTYDGTKIDIHLRSSEGDQSNYMVSTEWQLHAIRSVKNSVIYSCCPEPYPFIDVHITIQRRPMFFIFNLILPCILISTVALLCFYMPSNTGEKVTLGITSLLSTTVFLMLVADGMPPTSEALPLIGIYYGITIVLVSLATAMAVLTLNVHHHGLHGKNVPPIVQTIVFGYIARVLLLKIEQYHSINDHIEYFHSKNMQGSFSYFHTGSWPSVRSPVVGVGDVGSNRPDHPPSTNLYIKDNVSIDRVAGNSKRPQKKRGRVSFSDESTFATLSARRPQAGKCRSSLAEELRRASVCAWHHRIPEKGIAEGDDHSSQKVGKELLLSPGALLSVEAEVSAPVEQPSMEKLDQRQTVANNITIHGKGRIMPSPIKAHKSSSLLPSSYAAVPTNRSPEGFKRSLLQLLYKLNAIVDRNEMRLMEIDRRDAMRLGWQHVALVLDRGFLLLFLFTTILTSVLILYQRHLFGE